MFNRFSVRSFFSQIYLPHYRDIAYYVFKIFSRFLDTDMTFEYFIIYDIEHALVTIYRPATSIRFAGHCIFYLFETQTNFSELYVYCV